MNIVLDMNAVDLHTACPINDWSEKMDTRTAADRRRRAAVPESPAAAKVTGTEPKRACRGPDGRLRPPVSKPELGLVILAIVAGRTHMVPERSCAVIPDDQRVLRPRLGTFGQKGRLKLGDPPDRRASAVTLCGAKLRQRRRAIFLEVYRTGGSISAAARVAGIAPRPTPAGCGQARNTLKRLLKHAISFAIRYTKAQTNRLSAL